MVLLEAKDISVARAGMEPLRFPRFSIREGQKVLLLGPSGSGKTTFLSVLAGLLPPSSGTVTFRGLDFYALPPRARDRERGRNFGFVFQTLHLLPSLTLCQNIALAGDMAGRRAEPGRVDGLMNALGLADKARRRPEALSQGEQQRAAIARAVVNKPCLIFADEPTSALDDGNAQAVTDLLARQADENGAALLVASHDNRMTHRFNTIIMLESRQRAAA